MNKKTFETEQKSADGESAHYKLDLIEHLKQLHGIQSLKVLLNTIFHCSPTKNYSKSTEGTSFISSTFHS